MDSNFNLIGLVISIHFITYSVRRCLKSLFSSSQKKGEGSTRTLKEGEFFMIKKGGVIVSFGNKYLIAIEFDGLTEMEVFMERWPM